VTAYRVVAEPPADLDVAATFDWYEAEKAGLGREFLDELRATYGRVADGPLGYEDLRSGIRRALLSAVGGFVLNEVGTPQSGLTVRVFNQASQASCTLNTNLVAQDVTDANGFYFVYRTGTNQSTWASPNLPSGVRYAVQLCNAGVQVAPIQTLDSRLGEKEFEEIDFYLP